MIPDLNETAATGNQIMVGHSSTPDGNQYEILSRLSRYRLSSTLFLPLAYGDEDYKKEISTYALSLFPDVEVLSQKLEPKLYYQKLKDVGYCILNLKVQQGIGNITALLWYGVKVFLSIDSSTYLDFKDWGLIVFSIEEDLSEASLKTKLSMQEVLHNRKLLTHHLSESKLAAYWHNFN
jgi:hypothetical protein